VSGASLLLENQSSLLDISSITKVVLEERRQRSSEKIGVSFFGREEDVCFNSRKADK